MKKILFTALLLAIALDGMAQRQKTTVGRNGELKINGETVAYIEKEGCKLLSNNCQFLIVDENDQVLISATQRSFTDLSDVSDAFPNGTTVSYLVFAFRGFDGVSEIECPLTPKEETVANLIARWRLIKNKQLDPDAVNLFINSNGDYFSRKERMQYTPVYMFPPETPRH